MSDTATSTVEIPGATRRRRAFDLSGLRELALLPVIAIAVLIGATVNDAFLTTDNILENVLAASAVLGVLTVGAAIIIIGGHFDLSAQSVVAFAPMVSIWLVLPAADGGAGLGLSPGLGIVVMMLIGAAIGAFNGFLVARLKLNSFIVTLAMLILLQGVTLGVSGGETMTSLPDAYVYLGSATYLGVPAEVWVVGLVFLIAGLAMRFTVAGRRVYAVGGNPDAARAAGIRVERLTWMLFVLSGVLASLAGLLLTSRIASVTANQGTNIMFTVFAAAVIGGIDLNGGRGRIVGAATGVILLGVIQNILLVSDVPSFWVNAIYGAIILLALMLGALTQGSLIGRMLRRGAAKPAPAGEGATSDA